MLAKWNESWEGEFLQRHTWQGRRVVDYGIGAGLLGVEVLRRGASHYFGVDISKRSLATATKYLKRHVPEAAGRWTLLPAPQSFRSFHADVFVSQAVIQHFPSEWRV